MRVTSSMSNEASMQAGMPLGGGTLASYLNGDSSNSLVNSLGEKHHTLSDSIMRKSYQNVKETAEKVEQYAETLNQDGDNSIYEEARKSGDASEVYAEVEKLASAYNEMLDKIRTDTSTLGRFYRSSLKEAAAENEDALSAIGITLDKNGKMIVDKGKLESADVDRLESIFGASGTLSSKLGLIAEKIAENAEANLKSMSSQYNAAGSSVDTLIRSFDAKS